MPFYEKDDVRIRYEEAGRGVSAAGHSRCWVEVPRRQLVDRGAQRHEGFFDGESSGA